MRETWFSALIVVMHSSHWIEFNEARAVPHRRDDPVGKAAQAVEDVEDFTRRSKESSRRRAEVEAARDDLD